MTSRPGYVWDGSEWVQIGPVVNAPIAFQNTEPTSPATGDLWIDADGSLDSLVTNAGDFITQTELNNAIVGKADIAGETYTGTHNFGGATLTGAGLDLITTQTFSGVFSVNVNTCFSSTYRNYRLVVIHTGGNEDVNLRLRVSGTDSTTNYSDQTVAGDGSSATAGRVARGSINLGINTNPGISDFLIQAPALASATAMVGLGGNAYNGSHIRIITGIHTVATAYDGFTLIPGGAGTISGIIYVYGLKG